MKALYYNVKPYLPRRMRLGARRMLARWQRRRARAVWPISEAAGLRPACWPGWPDGKKFALVLTHDVESAVGLGRCRALMELEASLGVCSSFNFVPEGDYVVEDEFRAELASRGFETGIHDLHHDGKLYRNRRAFSQSARRINHYVNRWGAAGFRSGFMHHNLDWARDLDVKYDASTFDTDPFEPQPDGVGTIFPFWVSNPQGGGYVELPYTLPQDFTLFVLLQEEGPEIWIRKLEWLAKKGGMALVDVHPDYMNFGFGKPGLTEYPAIWYEEFIHHARSRYGGEFWNPLPSQLAEWYQREVRQPSAAPAVRRASPKKRVCMITHSVYESDSRVTRYAEALAERGDTVDILALKRHPGQPATDSLRGVNIFRLQARPRVRGGKCSYLLPLLRFWLTASARISWRHLRHPYDIVHVHNVPDFLVFAAWLPKLTGARVILDIHDIVPEFYASKFQSGADSRGVKLLKLVERLAASFADHVIISNHLWHQTYVRRSAPESKCSVFVNQVDSRLFYPRERTRQDGRIILIFPGGLQRHQGLDVAIRAFVRVARKLPTAEFHIYGEGNMKGEWMALAESLQLNGKVRFFEPLPGAEIAQVMSQADLGIVPKRADTFGNEAYSTKIMEFMALGVPVVASSTRIDRHYFDESLLRFFESGNPDALADAALEVLENEELRRGMAARAQAHAQRNSWDLGKADYLKLVDSLEPPASECSLQTA